MMLAVVVVIGVAASMLTSTGEKEMLPAQSTSGALVSSPSFVPEGPVGRESALEHASRHMQGAYRCLLHPEVLFDSPAICSICGEQLVWMSSGIDGAYEYLEKLAKVVPSAQRVKDVVLFGGGWVDRITVKHVGDAVTKGQLLMEVYSPQLKIDESQDNAMLRLYSPVAGTVSSIGAEEGKFVSSGATVMQLLDSSSTWLSASLTADEVLRVSAGQRVDVLQGGTGQMAVGEVDDIRLNQDGSAVVWLWFDAGVDGLDALDGIRVYIHARPSANVAE